MLFNILVTNNQRITSTGIKGESWTRIKHSQFEILVKAVKLALRCKTRIISSNGWNLHAEVINQLWYHSLV